MHYQNEAKQNKQDLPWPLPIRILTIRIEKILKETLNLHHFLRDFQQKGLKNDILTTSALFAFINSCESLSKTFLFSRSSLVIFCIKTIKECQIFGLHFFGRITYRWISSPTLGAKNKYAIISSL